MIHVLSQLHQSRLGLLSQALMMMVTVGFLFRFVLSFISDEDNNEDDDDGDDNDDDNDDDDDDD